MNYRIDNLQYCNWNEDVFKIGDEMKIAELAENTRK